MSRQTILLTGGIGAGKSVVSRILRLKGYRVYDTDSEARRIMGHDSSLRAEITARWGAQAYVSDSLNRPFVAERIFRDDDERLWLNRLVHARVREDFARACPPSCDTFFVECAIPVTSRIADMCSRIWMVDAPMEIRVGRAIRRDGSTPEKIMARILAQNKEYDGLPPDITDVIVNAPGYSILQQTDKLLNTL